MKKKQFTDNVEATIARSARLHEEAMEKREQQAEAAMYADQKKSSKSRAKLYRFALKFYGNNEERAKDILENWDHERVEKQFYKMALRHNLNWHKADDKNAFKLVAEYGEFQYDREDAANNNCLRAAHFKRVKELEDKILLEKTQNETILV